MADLNRKQQLMIEHNWNVLSRQNKFYTEALRSAMADLRRNNIKAAQKSLQFGLMGAKLVEYSTGGQKFESTK